MNALAKRPNSFSYSKVSAWRDCQAYGYVDGIEGLRGLRSPGTRLGTITHAAIASQIRGYCASLGLEVDGTIDKVTAIRESLAEDTYAPETEKQRTAEEDAELALELCDRTLNLLNLKSGRFTPVLHEGKPMIERKIRMPIDDPEVMDYFDGGFVFIADWLTRDAMYNNRLALVDWKISKYMDQYFELDVQLGLYQHALGQLGLWPELAWHYRIRDRPAQAPTLLKKRRPDGRSLSVQGPGLTTEAVFRDTCARVGDNPDGPEYSDFLEAVRTKNTLYKTILGGTDRGRAAALFADAVETARQMARAAKAGPTSAPRNIRSFGNSACSRCSLYSDCYMSKGTADLVKRTAERLNGKPQTSTLVVLNESDLEL